MPRKSMTGNKSSPYAKFRVDSEVQAILEDLKAQGGNVSQFIRERIKNTPMKNIDSQIIEKLFNFFANPAVRGSIPENLKDTLMASLMEGEQTRIQEILRGVSNE